MATPVDLFDAGKRKLKLNEFRDRFEIVRLSKTPKGVSQYEDKHMKMRLFFISAVNAASGRYSMKEKATREDCIYPNTDWEEAFGSPPGVSVMSFDRAAYLTRVCFYFLGAGQLSSVFRKSLVVSLALVFTFWVGVGSGAAQDREFERVEELYRAGELQQALDIASRSQDDPHALFLMSLIYQASGPLHSPDLAFQAAKRASSEFDYPPAMYLVGEYYADGFGTKRIGSAARANKNIALSMGYDPGSSPLDFLNNDPKAAEIVVEAYALKRKSPSRRDEQKITELFGKAASLGHTEAMRSLAMRHIRGVGAPKDGARAMQLIAATSPENRQVIEAATAGEVTAQYRVGHAFFSLTGDSNLRFPRSMELAMAWYGRAAAQGHAEALSDYAWLTLAFASTGRGTAGVIDTQDRKVLETAHGMLSLSLSQGSPTAKPRLNRVETLMRRKANRERAVALAVTALALIVYAAANSPDDPIAQPLPSNDRCAGMNGLGWIDDSMGNAAAIFGGCSKY